MFPKRTHTDTHTHTRTPARARTHARTQARTHTNTQGSGVAEWARALTGDRTVNGSSPAAVKSFRSLRNFGNSVYPALPVSFG